MKLHELNISQYWNAEKRDVLDLLNIINKKHFTIKDLNISYRKINNWQQEGLILDERDNTNDWRKFSFVDYVWIKTIYELRKIGISLKLIRNIYENIIKESQKAFLNFDKDDVLSQIRFTLDKATVKEIRHIEAKKIKKYEVIETDTGFNRLGVQIAFSIIEKKDLCLAVNNDGEYLLNDLKSSFTSINNNRWKSYTTVLISEFYKEFIQSQESNNSLMKLMLLDENEIEVLNQLKRENIKSVKIKFSRGKKIESIEITEEKKVEAEARLSDYILSGGYHNITYKTESGKIVSFERKTKIKK